ncbi:HlyD family efflux transporter periplasmic adaptor subunit [Bacillus aquiflavi]|uniref:HlyD family efflux transporter periplasmic adaptor subunit n=1 Tax=Bacillus aquiflavi TaxID=2672567 RepID=A0A6B3W3C8_9BACI|nr:HlyD family efflux transporter periplasmic adaptor subunit [Bacillus aquiflavi]MBA4538123.1 HlyD family efflux transporter periplasmic adaptor subunit [Bacillus aquiflavi]NEY82443.1 HlyD family efflux transporter periplasmic adaptor subunit [Bacillus aquiflavi]UAC48585.1 HlyD family secretion protein [Bacillus aquiflavi]
MKIYEINELTDSRIFYDRKPPRFLFIFIITLFLLMLFVVFWSVNSQKIDKYTEKGVIVPENTYQISSNQPDEISHVHVAEGQEVERGDLLIAFKSEDLKLEKEVLEKQFTTLTNRIGLLKRAETEARIKINTFDPKNEREAEFYSKLSANIAKMKEYEVDKEALRKQKYSEYEIAQYVERYQAKSEEIIEETIVSLAAERNELEMEKKKVESQLNALQDKEYSQNIYAPVQGTIHFIKDLNEGMVIPPGEVIAVITEDHRQLMIETMVRSNEIVNISQQSDVVIKVDGMNNGQSEVNGRVVFIDKDVSYDDKGRGYYKVKIKPTHRHGMNQLKSGMAATVTFVVNKTTYMNYFLKLVGVKA